MKKITTIVLSLILCFSLSACGSAATPNKETTTESTQSAIEKNVDAVAAELKLTGGSETMYEYIGAIAGKEFNDGEVEVYQFETDSSAYKEIEQNQSISGIAVSAYNDGFALIFPNNADDDIIKDFNALTFK